MLCLIPTNTNLTLATYNIQAVPKLNSENN